MWTTRLAVIAALTLATLVLPTVASGQVTAGMPRIGTLAFGAKPDEGIQIFLDQLHKLGYIERRGIVVEDRYAEGRPERLASWRPNWSVSRSISSSLSAPMCRFQPRTPRQKFPWCFWLAVTPLGLGLCGI